MITKDFIIIGGGIAGLSAIKAIREECTESSILWISDEDRIPYKRTQINKHIASGFQKNDFALIDHDWLVNNHIELLYDRVEGIDTQKHELSFVHRGHLKYKKCIIATGNRPNVINIKNMPTENIFHVNTARHVENLIRSSNQAKRYLVMGAGVEGVETAWQLMEKGKEVTILDKGNRVLQRFFNTKFSKLLENSINTSKANLILNAKHIEFMDNYTDEIIVKIDKQEHKFDAIVSTIGYSPNIELAEESQINCNKGILVNEYLETSATDIFAAGDVTEHPTGKITGLWHAAEHQGAIAGKNACGKRIKLELKPFRMKTEAFGNFYFSALPASTSYDLIEEENNSTIRELYFESDKLIGALVQNDKDRAKLYQQALLEKWDLSKIKESIPI